LLVVEGRREADPVPPEALDRQGDELARPLPGGVRGLERPLAAPVPRSAGDFSGEEDPRREDQPDRRGAARPRLPRATRGAHPRASVSAAARSRSRGRSSTLLSSTLLSSTLLSATQAVPPGVIHGAPSNE